jgi:single-strand DNA-binding protein
MVAGVNEWHGVGNMTADPKLREGEDESKDRCEFSIAINRPGQDSQPTYLDCIVWGKQAGIVADFGRRGRQVYVRGEIEVRKWTPEGEERERKIFRIKAFNVRFLDRKPDDEGRRRQDDEDEPPARRASGRTDSARSTTDDFSDLPF